MAWPNGDLPVSLLFTVSLNISDRVESTWVCLSSFPILFCPSELLRLCIARVTTLYLIFHLALQVSVRLESAGIGERRRPIWTLAGQKIMGLFLFILTSLSPVTVTETLCCI